MTATLLHIESLLLQQAAAGDEKAFTSLFRQYHPKVYQVGIMLLRSPVLAEELVQDIFLKIWLKREALAGIENFQSYLFIIARNDAFHKLRRQAKMNTILTAVSEEQVAYSRETEELILNRNHREILEEAIKRLPAKQQAVFRLSKLEGLKREEVATQLQIQPDTVKEHLSKASKNIRAYLLARGLTPVLLFVINRW